MVEHSFGPTAPVCYNGTYVVPIQSSITDDFSTYARVETYENTVNLICVPDPCDSEPLIANYTGSGCADTASNATCNVNCDQGYHQVNGPATCYAGVWTEPLPTCEEDSCPSVRQSEVHSLSLSLSVSLSVSLSLVSGRLTMKIIINSLISTPS